MGDHSGVVIQNGEKESTGAILQDVLSDVTNILRAEVRLARAEIKEDLAAAGKAGAMLGAAGLCGVLMAASLTACLIAGLSLIMPVWLAALLAAVFLACMGGAFYAGGRAKMRQVKPPLQETRQKVQGDYEWVKQQIK